MVWNRFVYTKSRIAVSLIFNSKDNQSLSERKRDLGTDTSCFGLLGKVIFGELLLQGLDKQVKIHRDGMSRGIDLSVMRIGDLFFAERCQIFGALPLAD